MQYSSSPEISPEKLTLRHFQTETDYHQLHFKVMMQTKSTCPPELCDVKSRVQVFILMNITAWAFPSIICTILFNSLPSYMSLNILRKEKHQRYSYNPNFQFMFSSLCFFLVQFLTSQYVKLLLNFHERILYILPENPAEKQILKMRISTHQQISP